ncbi:MAG: serine hydrolase domain-containing protein [Chloroflexota bacterium]
MEQQQMTISGYVEDGALPGLVSLIDRGGDVQTEVLGTMDLAGRKPMRRDALFRITSMSKPITATATLILVEDGVIGLDEPVDDYLPELAGQRVLSRIDGPLDDTVPAQRSITVRDLLTFRLGFGFAFEIPDDAPVLRAERELGLRTLAAPTPPSELEPNEWMRRFGSLPLMQQPGERWMYQTGTHVLSILIPRVSGMPLETFFQERIFGPLGMVDTRFSVPAEKRERFVDCIEFDSLSGKLELHDAPGASYWGDAPPTFPDGSGGLVSTVDDYHAFARMLLGGGKLGSERILREESVREMTTDQITPEQKAISPFFPGFWDSQGWGLGVGIATGPDDISRTAGRIGWGGGYGTSWYADPNEDLVAVLMFQRTMDDVAAGATATYWKSLYRGLQGDQPE